MKALVIGMTLIMFFAKIFGVMAFSWFTVFLPITIYLGFLVVILALTVIIAVIGTMIDR